MVALGPVPCQKSLASSEPALLAMSSGFYDDNNLPALLAAMLPL